jgi:ADP-ribose pyrophosphatase YjhB (NUDIX family)
MASDTRRYPVRPYLGVSVGVRRDDAILLVRRGRPPLAGIWSFPGGLVDLGERLEDAARREVREETGIETAILAQIDRAEIITRDGDGRVERHYVLIVFAGRPIGGTLAAGDDAAEARWVQEAELARLNLTEDTRRILFRGVPWDAGAET